MLDIKPPSLARSTGTPKTDWRDQMRTAFRSPEALLRHLGLAQEAGHGLAKPPFPMVVPLAFAERMRHADPDDPLLRQVLPHVDEQQTAAGFSSDPVGDLPSRQAPGILHKYQGRVLLIATGACAVHCRYCFRQNFPYATEHVGGHRWAEALAYLRAHTEAEELILSGGDPLMLPTSQLAKLTQALGQIPHIRRLRIHTRLPIVLPDRITENLLDWLSDLPWPVVIVIHANHPAEFDPAVDTALRRLRDANVILLNQAVLLAGVNDDAATLAALMVRGLDSGTLPYYLHLLDRVTGTARFEVDQARALALMENLRRRLPGYLVPRLVREQAGLPYKLPVL